MIAAPGWAHYQFNQRLLSRVPGYPGRVAVSVYEWMTSKTCGNCGSVNAVGAERLYRCVSCGVTLDRDVNGAHNNLLLAYTRAREGEEAATKRGVPITG